MARIRRTKAELEFADQQEAIRRQKSESRKDLKRRCDWNDPADRAFYEKERRRERRERDLDSRVPDRKCPECGIVRVKSRQWVIEPKAKKGAICKSCHVKIFQDPKLGSEGKLAKIRIKQAIARSKGTGVRFELKGVLLESAIQQAGLSKAEFSRRAGWKPTYTQKLVSNDKSINSDTMAVIIQVLAEKDVVLTLPETDWEAIYGPDWRTKHQKYSGE